jgi:transcriptional regulator with XRE-family HTH domain
MSEKARARVLDFPMQPPPGDAAATSTTRGLRERIGSLVAIGVTPRTIAARMGVSERWLRRWLKNETTTVLTVESLDRFDAYLQELGACVAELRAATDGDDEARLLSAFRGMLRAFPEGARSCVRLVESFASED